MAAAALLVERAGALQWDIDRDAAWLAAWLPAWLPAQIAGIVEEAWGLEAWGERRWGCREDMVVPLAAVVVE